MEQNDLAVVVQQNSGIEITKAQAIAGKFAEAMSYVNQVSPALSALNTNTPTAIDSQKAREFRLGLVKNRSQAEKIKNELKRGLIDEGKLIDGLFNVVANSSKMLETKLESVEKYVELQEKMRKEALKQARTEQLSKYEVDTTFYDLANMTDEGFATLLESSKIAYDLKVEKLRKEEEEAKLRQAKIILLNERKVEIAPYRDFIDKDFVLDTETLKELYDIQLVKAISLKKKFDIEQEAIRKENEKLKKIAEDKAKEDAEIEKKRQAELDRERKMKEEAEKKLKEIEAENAKQETIKKENERQALLAPDKEKIQNYFKSLLLVDKPLLRDADLSKKLDGFRLQLENLITNF